MLKAVSHFILGINTLKRYHKKQCVLIFQPIFNKPQNENTQDSRSFAPKSQKMLEKIKSNFVFIVLFAFAVYSIGRYFYKKPDVINGEAAPKIVSTQPNGESFDLSSLKGHYVLLDFCCWVQHHLGCCGTRPNHWLDASLTPNSCPFHSQNYLLKPR